MDVCGLGGDRIRVRDTIGDRVSVTVHPAPIVITPNPRHLTDGYAF
jgi:hypothetical protein